jgi:hypothetical protein
MTTIDREAGVNRRPDIGSAVLDVDGSLVAREASGGVLVLFGVEPKALTGRCLSELVYPQDPADLELRLRTAVWRGVGSGCTLGGMVMP